MKTISVADFVKLQADDWTWDMTYHLGYREPRFPVPAIPLEVDWYPDPLIIIICGTLPVSDADLKEERYWRVVWRSDGRYDWYDWL